MKSNASVTHLPRISLDPAERRRQKYRTCVPVSSNHVQDGVPVVVARGRERVRTEGGDELLDVLDIAVVRVVARCADRTRRTAPHALALLVLPLAVIVRVLAGRHRRT